VVVECVKATSRTSLYLQETVGNLPFTSKQPFTKLWGYLGLIHSPQKPKCNESFPSLAAWPLRRSGWSRTFLRNMRWLIDLTIICKQVKKEKGMNKLMFIKSTRWMCAMHFLVKISGKCSANVNSLAYGPPLPASYITLNKINSATNPLGNATRHDSIRQY
jgi:hypothetical protein